MFWEGEKRRALGPTDNIHKMTTVVLPRARALPLCCSGVLVSTNPPLTDCDTYAASDSDPHPKAPGLHFTQIDPKKAVPACEDALSRYPNSLRFQYQLGLSLIHISEPTRLGMIS